MTTGNQFYVTHCTPADSVRNNPGYSVRAASTTESALLDAALNYPPYELPIDLWKGSGSPTAAPRRLARTKHSDTGTWVVHSAYLEKDTVARDRSYFSHLMLLPAADPAAVLRSWGSSGWTTGYPPGATGELSGTVRLPIGTLVNDAALTAFLGDTPPGPLELSTTVCPTRLRSSAAQRRDLLARTLRAVLMHDDDSRRLYIHAEPGLVALLLYGAIRLLPRSALAGLTFSTFEPYHRNIRGYKLADVVGTYLGAANKGLDEDIAGSRGIALDTFVPARSSPELRQPLTALLPPGASDLIDLIGRGGWSVVEEIHRMVGGEWDVRAWLAEAGARASGKTKLAPPGPQVPSPDNLIPATEVVLDLIPASEVLSLDPEPEVLSLDDAEPVASAPASAPKVPSSKRASALPPARPVGGMTYAAQISRTNPACLVFLIDQSKSMADPFPGTGQTKAGVVADALNRLIQNVVLRSAKADGVRDYFRVGVIGYGTGVKAGLGGSVPFNVLVPVSKLGAHPLRVETRTKLIPDGVGGVLEQKVKFPVWFDAEASGQTPMCSALAAAGLAVKGFVEEFPGAYPPIVLNLTDGMPSDGNPQLNARQLTNMGTSDGAVLLFNLLISSKPVPADYFPGTEERLPDTCSKLLYRMSSVLPPRLWEAAKAEGHPLAPRARGVVINADPTAIVRFLDIGTRVTPSGK